MRPVSRHAQRGQVLPVWALGIVGMLVLVLAVLRYADVVRWQIRAQNAADAAAQSVLALQTQQFNEMNSELYAAAVEEYRIRALLYGMELTAFGNGGCSADGSCAARYSTMHDAYLKAVARYQSEVVLLHRTTANMDATTMKSDAAALVQHLVSACGQAGGGDCAFSYALVDYSGRSPLYTVSKDARAFVKPSLGYNMTPASGVNPSLIPAQVEVAVCADVPSPVPGFLNFQPKPHRVIARAAATAVMVEQDWFQPGQLENPWTGKTFQTPEQWSGSAASDGMGNDWYAVDFGGNANKSYVDANGYTFGIYTSEFSAFTGWWNSVPMRPYTVTSSDTSLGCAS